MKIQVIRLEQNHMATTFDLRISCGPERAMLAERTLEQCLSTVARLERELTEFREISPVYQLNHSEPGTRIRFSEDGMRLLERAIELQKLSRNAFDPLAKSRDSNPGLAWDPATCEVWRKTSGTWLGFGAIGKGYALDVVRAHIEMMGFTNYLLCAGGSSIVLSGEESPGAPWSWGWSWKKNELGENLGVVLSHESTKRIALGVSGTHEKGEHLIDRRGPGRRIDKTRSENAHPASQKLRSALVATSSAADADALSTALFVSGWDDSKDYLDSLPLPPAVAWIDRDEVPHWNGIFKNLWNGVGAAFLALLPTAALVLTHARTALCDQSIDLSSLAGAKAFTPYVFDRNSWWVLLPIFMFFVVLSHLRKTKPIRDRKKLMKKNITNTTLIVATLAWFATSSASAVTIEPLGKAVISLLQTTKAQHAKLNDGQSNVDVFYTKGNRAVVIEHGLYKPDCTHTWAIGLNTRSATVIGVKPIEMKCPHAFPTRSASFLDQFNGKGPADVAKLSSQIHTVAKATGTSNLTTDAVKRSIQLVERNKGRL